MRRGPRKPCRRPDWRPTRPLCSALPSFICIAPSSWVLSLRHTRWVFKKTCCTIKTSWWDSWTLRGKGEKLLSPVFLGLGGDKGAVSAVMLPLGRAQNWGWPRHTPTASPVSSCMSKWLLACSDLCRIQHAFDFKKGRKAEKPLPTRLGSCSWQTAAPLLRTLWAQQLHAGCFPRPGLPPPRNRDFVL